MEMQRKFFTPKTLPIFGCRENSRELDLLQAIGEGLLENVQQLLRPDSPPMNLNYIDSLGRTPLMLATEKEHVNEQIVRLLVESGASTEAALINAVKQKNRRAFEILLRYHNFKTEDTSNQKTSPEELNIISPLILAIKLGDFEMVTHLMAHGYDVLEHHTKCSCIHCTSAETIMAKSLIRLESYKALANPMYICAQYIMNSNNNSNSNKDPIHTAFVLSTKVKHQAIIDYEYKDDYISLYDALNDFSVGLLELCQNIKEVQVVMDTCEDPEFEKQNIPDEARHLNMLDIAIEHQNEQVNSIEHVKCINGETNFIGIFMNEPAVWLA